MLSLALGIGANTAIFTLIDALLLRPLPVPNAHELVIIGDPTRQAHPTAPRTDLYSYPVYDASAKEPTVRSPGSPRPGRTGRLDLVINDGKGRPMEQRDARSPSRPAAAS